LSFALAKLSPDLFSLTIKIRTSLDLLVIPQNQSFLQISAEMDSLVSSPTFLLNSDSSHLGFSTTDLSSSLA